MIRPGQRSSCSCVPQGAARVGALSAPDELDPVTVRILDKAEPRASLAHLVRLALRLDALLGESRQRAVEIVDPDRDVAVGRAELVRAAVLVVGQLALDLPIRQAVDVTR